MDADGETVVGVAHEALLRQWQPLRDAIEAARTSLRIRSELERLTTDQLVARVGPTVQAYLVGDLPS